MRHFRVMLDVEQLKRDALDPTRRRQAVKDDILSTLAAHYPAPLSHRDLMDLYARYYQYSTKGNLVTGLVRFLRRLEREDYITTEEDGERNVIARIRTNEKTREYLQLMPCMRPIERCSGVGCRSVDRCPAAQAVRKAA